MGEDENESRVPDEYDTEMMMMSGGEGGKSESSEGESVSAEQDVEASMESYQWCIDQTWQPDSEYSGLEQLKRMMEKKAQLGIWISVSAHPGAHSPPSKARRSRASGSNVRI